MTPVLYGDARVPDHYWQKVCITDSGCWEWVGGRFREGYGYIKADTKVWRAHRLFYSQLVRALAPGENVLHRCDNPPCVNPAHLFIGTQKDNMRDCAAKGRIFQQRKTHCPKGHPYDAANTGYKRRKRGPVSRHCMTCKRAEDRAARLANLEKYRVRDRLKQQRYHARQVAKEKSDG